MSLEQTLQLCAIFPKLRIERVRPLGDMLHLVARLPGRVLLAEDDDKWLRGIIDARRIFALIVAVSGDHMRIRPLPSWSVRNIPTRLANDYLEWLLQRARMSFFNICSGLPLELQERIAQCFLPSECDVSWGAPPTKFVIGSDELAWL